jgi:non-homologous end joining protein Ku
MKLLFIATLIAFSTSVYADDFSTNVAEIVKDRLETHQPGKVYQNTASRGL